MLTKQWKCTVCNYIHIADNPPEKCPECDYGPEVFELLGDIEVNTSPEQQDKIRRALFTIQYGLFVVGSSKDGKINGQICNTVFQITTNPVRVVLGINKNNLTHEYIKESGSLSICVLSEDCIEIVQRFGFQSGRETNKYKGIDYSITALGNPVIKDALVQLDCKVEESVDLGTHTLFVVDVIWAEIISDDKAITYEKYRELKQAMRAIIKGDSWKCCVCSYIHEGEAPPEECPLCKKGPEEFKKI